MRKYILVFVALAVFLVPASLFAAGAAEPEAVEMVSPSDAGSDDVLLQQGLPPVADQATELELLTTSSGDGFRSFSEFLEGIFQRWYPNITVDAQPTETGDLRSIVATRLAAGEPPPAVHVAGRALPGDWIEAGALRNLSDIWDEYNLHDLVPEALQDDFMWNGSYYGIPIWAAAGSPFIWYNLDLIRDAGVPEPPYADLDELVAAGQAYVEATGEPFYVEGYTPAWFAMTKTISIAAAYYGPELRARFSNGNATAEDFRNALSLHKRILDEVGNPDYMSVDSIAGTAEAAARGDGAAAITGPWGLPRFTDAGFEFNEGFTFQTLPGHQVLEAVSTGFYVFEGTEHEAEAIALAVSAMLEETQLRLAPEQGVAPTRVGLDADDLPRVGRYQVTEVAMPLLERDDLVGPFQRPDNAIPSAVAEAFPPVLGEFFAGDRSLESAVEELLRIQEQFGDRYTDWGDFGLDL